MKFTIDSSEFSKTLERAAKFISAKPLMPILASIKLVTDDAKVGVTAFNLAHGIKISCEAEIIKDGSICLPLSAVTIIKLMPGQLIVESDENHSITISNLGGNIQIQGQSSDEYPELIEDGDDEEIEGTSIELDASSFSLLLKTCGQSTSSDDESKTVLTGVNIGASKGKLTAIATNGHRLTVLNLPVDESISIAPITIPSKSINLIDTGKSDNVEISSTKSQVSIGCSDSRSIMRIIEGRYPDALMLLPKAFARILTLDRKKLIDCLNVMNAISDKNNLVEFHILEKSLSIYSKSDGKTGEQKMNCTLVDPMRLESEEFAIAFNLKYLIEGLKMFDTTSVAINMNSPTEPVVLQAVGSDIDLIYLVMPIQIRE